MFLEKDGCKWIIYTAWCVCLHPSVHHKLYFLLYKAQAILLFSFLVKSLLHNLIFYGQEKKPSVSANML